MEVGQKVTAVASAYESQHWVDCSERPDQFVCLLDVLGKGSMAKVSLVLDVQSRLVATLKTYKPDKARFAHRELAVFQQTTASPHLAHCLDAFLHNTTPIFLTEYAPFGTLDQLTLKTKGLGSHVARVYAMEIASAVEFLHRRSILHRDIKPANVLILTSGHVVLSDFSSAFQLTDHAPLPFQICGTHITRPPEVWSCKSYSFPVDVWQMGISFYNIVSNRWPFFHAHAATQARAVKSGDHFPLPSASFSPDMASLITQMLQVNPAHRISASQVSKHDFFKILREPYEPPLSPSALLELMNFSELEAQIVKQLMVEVSSRDA